MVAKKTKISVVSYINSLPFVYGIKNSVWIQNNCEVTYDVPSICAEKLIKSEVDVGLVPVAVIPQIKNARIITPYCIGTDDFVRSVMLFSNVSIPEIKKIYLDYQSRTSVRLVRFLAEKKWNISPQWVDASAGYENKIQNTDAAVIIGDRAIEAYNKFPYQFDLAHEWKLLTGKPFVFACWVSANISDAVFEEEFTLALKTGVENIQQVIKEIPANPAYHAFGLEEYFYKNISYFLTAEKKEALNHFLSYSI